MNGGPEDGPAIGFLAAIIHPETQVPEQQTKRIRRKARHVRAECRSGTNATRISARAIGPNICTARASVNGEEPLNGVKTPEWRSLRTHMHLGSDDARGDTQGTLGHVKQMFLSSTALREQSPPQKDIEGEEPT